MRLVTQNTKQITVAILVIVAILIPSQVLAIPASFDWGSFDSGSSDAFGIYDWDDATVLQTGDLAQFIWAGPDGMVDPPLPDGTPGGDDELLDTNQVSNGLPLPPDLHDMGYLPLKTYTFDSEAQQNGGVIYIRAWNAATPAEATAYGDSATGTLGDSSALNAPRWHVIAPIINHAPPTTAYAGVSLPITATITSEAPPITATLYYSSTGDSAFSTLSMVNMTGAVYSATIPAGAVVTPTLSYYIGAVDTHGANTDGPQLLPVAAQNFPPVAEDDGYAMNVDEVLAVAAPGVLDNDSDLNGDPLTAVLVSDVSSGTLSLLSDGSFVYTPTVGYYGNDRFTYKANDGQLDSNVAEVIISIALPLPSPPLLNAPSGMTFVTTHTYTWQESAHAFTYNLLVSEVGGSNVINRLYSAGAICGGGVCSVNPPEVLAEGDYVWFVRSENPTGRTWSEGMDFAVSLSPPEVPLLIEPTGVTSEVSHTYRWYISENAQQYDLLVTDKDGNVVFSHLYQADAICSGNSCSVTPIEELTEGRHLWYVRARNPFGNIWSAGEYLTVFFGGPPTKPVLIAPIGVADTLTPSFSWAESVDALEYDLFLLNDDRSFRFSERYFADEVCSAGTCVVTPTLVLAEEPHLWYIRAKNPLGRAWSAGGNFTVFLGGPLSTPVPLAPMGAIAETQPTYSWVEDPNALRYLLFVFDDSGATVFASWYTADLACAAGVCTVTPPVTLTAGNYSWNLKANNPLGNAWGPRTYFTVTP